MSPITDRLASYVPQRFHGRLAVGMHRAGLYRLGGFPFGAIDRNLMLDRFGIDLVFDVGANVGGWARQLRERGYDGRIVSIEPGSRQFAALSQAASSDPKWEAIRAGVGDVDEVRRFHVSSDLVSSSFLDVTERFSATHTQVDVTTTEDVEVCRLDRFAGRAESDSRVWVKLDVEGYELRAIAGAHDLLSNTSVVDIEMTTARFYEGEPLFYEVAPALYELGFELIAVASAVTAPTGRTVRFDGLFGRPDVVG